jgi:predicted alpha-1,2-mannosidase
MNRTSCLLVLLAACGSAGSQGADAVQDSPDAPDVIADVPPPREIPELTRFVDPFIGTKGPGNAIPGPVVPHGMVKLSPDTSSGPGTIEGYEWSDDRIEGFSHTHFEGPGGSQNGYSQVLLTPGAGPIRTTAETYAQNYSHASESASPGYYAVTLADSGIRAELTATRLCGVHRYTFPAAAGGWILVDAGHTRGAPVDCSVEVVGKDTLRGTGVHQVNPAIATMLDLAGEGAGTGLSTVHFVARFSRPFASSGTFAGDTQSPGALTASGERCGAWAGFDTSAGGTVEVRVGLSFISLDQAEANLEAEVAGRTFDAVRQDAVRAWDRLLSRIEVEGGTDADRTKFYTALYRSFLQPSDYTEAGRFFSGADGKGAVFQADGWRYYTDDWCIWDTFRTVHPLLTLVEPEVPSDMVRSLVHLYEQGGWMPKCPWNATGDSRVMTANPQFSVVVDAWLKGFRGFDGAKAYEAMRKGSMEDSAAAFSDGLCGYFNQGTPPEYVNNGWVPYECDPFQAASMTLEHAYDDWVVSRMAWDLGKGEDAALFEKRSGNWRNVFNPAHRFAQCRRRDGTWVEPFDPAAPDGFTEANSWQYTWSVQHDVCGLVAAMGGDKAFAARLDEFFDDGHFTPDNEPDFHVPWLYDFVGLPRKASERVAAIRANAFGTGPDGLPGNDDAGATSAWYVLAAIGLYPVTPGDGTWWLSSPAFDRIVLWIDPDRKPGVRFEIVAEGATSGKPYIRSATLDGTPVTEPRLAHERITAGGRLVLEMGDQPTAWGTGPVCAPGL